MNNKEERKISLKQIFEVEELIGKQIIRIGTHDCERYFSLIFSDNTFVILKAYHYGMPEIKICVDENYEREPRGKSELNDYLSLRLLDEKQFKELAARLNEIEKQEQQKRDEKKGKDEIAQLKKLLEKYPDIR